MITTFVAFGVEVIYEFIHRKERYSDALDWLTNVGSGEIPTDLPQLPTDEYKGDIRLHSRYKPNDNKY